MPIHFAEFAQAYSDEHIPLHPLVMQAGIRGAPTRPQSMHDDVPLMAPLVEAAELLRQSPGTELAAAPLRREFPRGTIAHALRLLLNTSVEPQQVRPEALNFTSDPVGNIDACGAAEDYFLSLARRLTYKVSPEPVCDIFTYKDRPVILRKNRSFGAPSALSLARISINGVVFPPFSLLRAEAENDNWYENEEGTASLHTSREQGILRRPIDELTAIGFMRITSLTLPAHRRAAHFTELSVDEEVFDTRAFRTLLAQ
jgi:hypothetical protein